MAADEMHCRNLFRRLASSDVSSDCFVRVLVTESPKCDTFVNLQTERNAVIGFFSERNMTSLHRVLSDKSKREDVDISTLAMESVSKDIKCKVKSYLPWYKQL